MRFPLADWIDAHADCRHNLGVSGMKVALPPPRPPATAPPEGVDEELRAALARHLGVATDRLFLTHGATEANAWVLVYLSRRTRPGRCLARIRFPEYPPLLDAARAAGFAVTDRGSAAAVAIVSQPRNPGGDLWSDAELTRWSTGARHLLVDETFREFAGTPSRARAGRRGRWATGSFTKYFGGDELRVGFAVAPPEEAQGFGRCVGVLSDEVSSWSADAALRTLRALPSYRRAVGAIVRRNLAVLARELPAPPAPVAPLYFDRLHRTDGDRLARRALAASVLVCPGSFFGERRGVRLCLTRRSFEVDLRAYLAVRDRLEGPRSA